MRPMPKSLFLLALLLCAGCTRASSDARRDHLLAGPHGWIDVTVRAPAAAASAAKDKTCGIAFSVNGEPFVAEAGDLAQADAAGNPLGYRVAVPAGALKTELSLDRCVPAPLSATLPLTLEADHLALLEFDGAKLVVTSTQAWQPATLDGLHAEVAALAERGAAADARSTRLTWLAGAILLLNLVLVAIVLRRST